MNASLDVDESRWVMSSGPGALGHGELKSFDAPEKVHIAGTEDVRLQSISSGKTHMLGMVLVSSQPSSVGYVRYGKLFVRRSWLRW